MLRFNQQFWNALTDMGLANIPLAPTENAILQWSNNGTINANVLEHIQSYLNLPAQTIGPYEIHPYIDRESAEFDLTRTHLLLGTFPPNSYLQNILQLNVNANLNVRPSPIDFYYGNRNTCWTYFQVPTINNQPMNANAIRTFLTQNSIAIADVILGAQREVFKESEDRYLCNVIPNKEICNALGENSDTETILLTSGVFNDIQIQNGQLIINRISTLSIFLHILNSYSPNIEMSIDVSGNGQYSLLSQINFAQLMIQQNGGIIWWIKIGDRRWRIINLPSPSRIASRTIATYSHHYRRWAHYKANTVGIPLPVAGANLKNYMLQYPNVFNPKPTNQYRSEIYNLALNDIPRLNTI